MNYHILPQEPNAIVYFSHFHRCNKGYATFLCNLKNYCSLPLLILFLKLQFPVSLSPQRVPITSADITHVVMV